MGERCQAGVYERDQYCYTGRTKSGYEMHYDRRQCKRPATYGGYCPHHAHYYEAAREAYAAAHSPPPPEARDAG